MRATFLIFGLIIVIAVFAGMWQAKSPTTTSTAADSPAPKQEPSTRTGGAEKHFVEQPTKRIETPNASSLDALSALAGQQRPEEPGTQAPPIEKVIRPNPSHKSASIQEAQHLLSTLDPTKLTPNEKEALRWSLFETSANETIRNDTANVLLNAADPALAGALTTLLLDQRQTPLWRNYCIQHLALGYRRLGQNNNAIKAMFQATETDPDETVRDAGLMHLSRLANEFNWTKTQPAWHQRATLLTKRFLTEEGRTETERISGARATAELLLLDEAQRLLSWLRETTTPLGQRQAAASTLPKIGKHTDEKLQKEIIAALQSISQDRNQTLRQLSQKGIEDLKQ